MKKYTHLFFDLDHTLWDFEKNSALTFELLFEKHGLDIEIFRFLRFYRPINFGFWKLYREGKVSKDELRYQRLKQSFDAYGIAIDDQIINRLSNDYIRYLSTFVHVVPGTFQLLDYLRVKYRMHIITNGFSEVQQRKMVNSKIRGYFEVVVNSEMAGVKKPNPKIFNLALERAKVAPQNAIMIGDNLEADVIGALKVGLSAIHFNSNNETPHDHAPIVNDLDEIKRYL